MKYDILKHVCTRTLVLSIALSVPICVAIVWSPRLVYPYTWRSHSLEVRGFVSDGKGNRRAYVRQSGLLFDAWAVRTINETQHGTSSIPETRAPAWVVIADKGDDCDGYWTYSVGFGLFSPLYYIENDARHLPSRRPSDVNGLIASSDSLYRTPTDRLAIEQAGVWAAPILVNTGGAFASVAACMVFGFVCSFVVRMIRVRRRIKMMRCWKCGYQLVQGCPLCSECGTPTPA